ncbi:C cytochrome [Bacillus canaveralius]|uniref:C cytochrome n=1 Tax=Bacillus canaveralius TaxID=1403243 RepID=A0A2N5GL80_9BACI|nr:c-type cytochrome [Bacillus canaveralius]PLR82208.1 C cytochrome [Bacillus canaveralius]PLR97886.1 C cytochrome [Bacillus canaveralius]
MNKLFISSVLAIVMTMVLGFSALYLFVLDSKNQLPVKVSTDDSPVAQVEKSNHPYPPPSMDDVPEGEEGELIKLGEKAHNETNTVLDGYVGNTLSCASCHANGGVDSSLDLVGVSKTYPQYNSRAGRVVKLEDRINGCFKRSMNGKPLPLDSKEMKAMVAYYSFISTNVPDGTKERPLAKLTKAEGDLAKVNIDEGRETYNKACITCHGEDGSGAGTGLALWGDKSYNIGAGMARNRTAAGFIKEYMPKAPTGGYEPGSLTEEEAMNIAAYINSMNRPDFPDKIKDWPKGDAPDDAAYETLASKKETEKK